MSTPEASTHARSEGGASLAGTACGIRVRVRALALEASEAAWLSAVGVSEGEILTVLRRAPLGGPLHVESALGAEFAIGPSLAEGILVEAAP